MDPTTSLARIGAVRPLAPSAEALSSLQVAHVLHVPFEILDIVIGRSISLELPAIYDKIVTRRRGGFCYELNGLFAWLLDALGYRTTRLSERRGGALVAGPRRRSAGRGGRRGGGAGAVRPVCPPLVLRVDLDEPWLVDIG